MFEEFYEMYEPEEQEVIALINRCIQILLCRCIILYLHVGHTTKHSRSRIILQINDLAIGLYRSLIIPGLLLCFSFVV